ncbi:MAG: pyridoxamine 5'-phosphate oxidase family protein [Candidatus Bathyarchaeia archaeon]
MQFDDCIKFSNDNPSSYIATTEGDQPRVRGMLMWFADKTGFYYNTGATKDLYKQLQANPKVELCFFDPKSQNLKMMRVTGKAEFVNDIDLRERLVAERPFLKQMGLTAESPGLILFRVPKGEAFFWTWDTNLEPKRKISFG